jgi:zinc/manganese transport system substrate-binding protein
MLAAAAFVIAGLGGPSAAEPVKVIATFSILGDLVAKVGGDNVELVTLVGPDADAHVYQPSPADARATAAADLVVVNGQGFEGWLDRLVEASGYEGTVVVASTGADLIEATETEAAHHGHAHDAAHETPELAHQDPGGEDQGGSDPHAWQSIANAEIYVKNIAEALCAADPDSCAEFSANAARYTGELRALDATIKSGFAAVPPERRKVITSHDAFGYFARAYGIEFLAPQGASTESEASAADVARLIGQIREAGVTALFVENIADPRLIEQIGRETGVRPGGKLFSDALSDADGPAPTYLDMMRYNAGALQAAMQGS